MNNKKKGLSFKARILLLAAIPAIAIGFAVLITSIFILKKGMESEVLKGLQIRG